MSLHKTTKVIDDVSSLVSSSKIGASVAASVINTMKWPAKAPKGLKQKQESYVIYSDDHDHDDMENQLF